MLKKASIVLVVVMLLVTFSNVIITFAAKNQPPSWSSVEKFVPAIDASPATEKFSGRLSFTTTEMNTNPKDLSVRYPWAKWTEWGFSFDFLAAQDPEGAVPLYELDAKLFPGLEVQFFSDDDGNLIPVQHGIIRRPVRDRTKSFWEIIVGPGKVWNPRDDKTKKKWRGWNKAAFPFSLVQSYEGEALLGLAFFYYKGDKVSKLYFQVSNDTAGGFIFWDDKWNMTAWGTADLAYTPRTFENETELQEAFANEVANRFPMKPLSEFGEDVTEMGGDVSKENVLTMGIVKDGVIYHSPINTPFGEYPYPYGMRVGVWSLTKSLIPGMAALRLAQKYGTNFLDTKIVDYFDEDEFTYKSAKARTRFEEVTIRHALNMTTGMGPSGYDPNWDGSHMNTYKWGYSYDLADQIRFYFNQEPNPNVTGPGEKFYYLDQDMWAATLAMQRFLQEKEGSDTTILNMLKEEVYKPIGVDHFATGTSYTETGEPGFPLSGWGALPTIDYLAKVGRLIVNKGATENGTQLLHRGLIESFFTNPEYQLSFWKTTFTNENGEDIYIPTMEGAGGNDVFCMPNGLVGITLGYNSYNFSWTEEQKLTIIEAANKIKPF